MPPLDRAGTITEWHRFNALSEAEAKRIMAMCLGKEAFQRICWYCKPTNTYLSVPGTVIYCTECHIMYVHGYPGPALHRRWKGEPVTEEFMLEFNDALRGAVAAKAATG